MLTHLATDTEVEETLIIVIIFYYLTWERLLVYFLISYILFFFFAFVATVYLTYLYKLGIVHFTH